MKFIRTDIPDVIIIEPTVHGDSRGYFCETFRQDLLEEFLQEKTHFCQDNESRSDFGVLRGLHYQLPPFTQSKLVRVIQGRVLDVAVDIRTDSATYGRHVSVDLSSENKRQLYIPKGFAHGFLVLENDTVFTYKVDNSYAPGHDRGIAFNDPAIGIKWPITENDIQLSEKDARQPLLSNADRYQELT